MSEEHADLFNRLGLSAFRKKFRLSKEDRTYIASKGLSVIKSHAADFIANRIAPAVPRNDGKQTPMHGHPVFTAQHATATCCRGCIAKWHGIGQARPLTTQEQQYLVDVVMAWIDWQSANKYPEP
jgi:hypothetical protein